MRRFLMFLPALALMACATTNPQQAVFTATSAYGAALKAAVVYESLPRCGVPMAPPICSEPTTVAAIRRADTAAKTALDAAQETVRTPGFGDEVYTSAAQAALATANAFAAIVAQQ